MNLPPRRAPKKAQHQHNHLAGPRHTVLVFGPPGSGATTLGGILAHEDVLPELAFVDRVNGEPLESLMQRIDGARNIPGKRTVLVGGAPNSPDELQKLAHVGIADPVHSILVRLWRPDGIEPPHEWSNMLGYLEQKIWTLRIPYTTLINDEVDRACASLAKRAGYM